MFCSFRRCLCRRTSSGGRRSLPLRFLMVEACHLTCKRVVVFFVVFKQERRGLLIQYDMGCEKMHAFLLLLGTCCWLASPLVFPICFNNLPAGRRTTQFFVTPSFFLGGCALFRFSSFDLTSSLFERQKSQHRRNATGDMSQ